MIKHSNPVYFAKITSQRNIGILPKNLPKQLKLFKFPASVFCCLLFLQHLRQTQDETILSKNSDTKKLLVLYPCVIQTGFMSKIIIGTYKIFSRMCERAKWTFLPHGRTIENNLYLLFQILLDIQIFHNFFLRINTLYVVECGVISGPYSYSLKNLANNR